MPRGGGLFRQQLDLTRDVVHDPNAAWFRVDAVVDVETFSDDPGVARADDERRAAVPVDHSQLGIADRLHLERFSASPAVPDEVGESSLIDDGFEVELARTGTIVPVEPEVTTLDALRSVSPNLPFDCEAGICGTCEAALLASRFHVVGVEFDA
jgi:hypothetical protein